jgi:hypothetical protein
MKQTAVEWLEEELAANLKTIVLNNDYTLMEKIFAKAKAMEKEQITEAYDAGLFDGSMDIVKDRMYKKYYDETYNK